MMSLNRPAFVSAAEAAAAFGSATLHEAAGRMGALPARLRPAFAGAALAGRAYPVYCPAGDNLWIHRALYQAEPGDVLVIATSAPDEYGYWGEILSEAAVARGLAGLVIDGGVRDTAHLGRVGFPVFSSSVCIRGTIKDPQGRGVIGEPVVVGEVTVNRGDLVVGDGDGVVAIPEHLAGEVLASSAAREARERDIIAQLRAGKTTLELYSLPSAVIRHDLTRAQAHECLGLAAKAAER
jgi:4-hydroxy-4-methyl-2-oxoglutarate aldolase